MSSFRSRRGDKREVTTFKRADKTWRKGPCCIAFAASRLCRVSYWCMSRGGVADAEKRGKGRGSAAPQSVTHWGFAAIVRREHALILQLAQAFEILRGRAARIDV